MTCQAKSRSVVEAGVAPEIRSTCQGEKTIVECRTIDSSL